jgi:predicted deacylase
MRFVSEARIHGARSRHAVAGLVLIFIVASGPAYPTTEDAPIDEVGNSTPAEVVSVLEDSTPSLPIELLGESLKPGTLTRLELRTSESFSGSWLSTPVAIVHGRRSGPKLCVIAGIHGDEVNGVDVVRQLLRTLDPNELAGTVIAVPIANLSAFRRGSRYLPDRRDLNRFFPGRPFGSSASRIAHGIFVNIVTHCDALVDLHTGSFQRTNVHQLRANLADAATANLSHQFGANIVVNSVGRMGTLRRAATDAGIPAITVEAGESTRFNAVHVAEALQGILRLLDAKGMLDFDDPKPPGEAIAFLRTRWLRCDNGGILVSRVRLGDEIYKGQTLGTISDPLSDSVTEITAPIAGRVIGIAVDQVVMPGFAAFHLGYNAKAFGGDSSDVTTRPEVGEDSHPEGMDLEERPE